jgi:hypothetical protein
MRRLYKTEIRFGAAILTEILGKMEIVGRLPIAEKTNHENTKGENSKKQRRSKGFFGFSTFVFS